MQRKLAKAGFMSGAKVSSLVVALMAMYGGAASAQHLLSDVDAEIEKIVIASADSADSANKKMITIRTNTTGGNGAGVTSLGDDLVGAKFDHQLKNAPYAATAITEKVQLLRDGNAIRQSTSKRLYRDANGRTRDESLNATGEITSVRINDFLENGAMYVLKPGTKTATKLNLKLSGDAGLAQSLAGLEPAIQQRVKAALSDIGGLKVGVANASGTSSSTTGTGAPGDPKITVMRMEGADGANALIQGKTGEVLVMERSGENITTQSVDVLPGGKGVRTIVMKRLAGDGAGAETLRAGDVRIDALRLEAGADLGGNASGMLSSAMRESSFAKTAVKSALGNRDFYGVRAEGTLSTYTIPANAVGNQQPIVVSEEIWRSPELKLVVYSKRSDPRYGDTIYRLENISRTEPSANLFAVPTDYKVSEPTFSVNGTSIKK